MDQLKKIRKIHAQNDHVHIIIDFSAWRVNKTIIQLVALFISHATYIREEVLSNYP